MRGVEMNNVQVVDKRAERLRKLVTEFGDKPVIILPSSHTIEYLECLDRLKSLERMLNNINSNYYEIHNAKSK